jgi:hypothetical protein
MDISLEWVLGGAFGLQFALLLIIWNSIHKKFDKVDQRFDKLEEKVTDIDRRLCRLEGAFASKDCCMIKDHRIVERAE